MLQGTWEARTYTYRELVQQPGLHPVPPEWMHVTLLHMGPQDSASTSETEQLAAAVAERAAAIASFDLTLSRPDIGTVAIESKGYPGAPHRALWEMTWQATYAVVGDRWPRIPATSYPHLSHAYANSRELHQAGENPQVTWSRRETEGVRSLYELAS